MSISLCTFVKNESNCLNNMINSVYDYVDEVVVVDTGSTDGTCDSLGDYKKARIYKVGFSDFGSLRTLTSHLARCDWVLGLDADETLDNPKYLFNLTQDRLVSAFAFPRKRWLDVAKTKQIEIAAYPDWQVRFYRNNINYVWKRELHEYFDGTGVVCLSNGPIINHFQDVYKDAARNAERKALYEVLAKEAHVTLVGGKPV